MIYDIKVLSEISKKHGYVRNTYEKVLRLVSILKFINYDTRVKGKLALKGGTALNLLYDDLPRLSVDIDLDYTNHLDKNLMLNERISINKALIDYFTSEDYRISKHSKKTYSLDSHVLSYTPCGGGSDNIKVEINYSMRGHLLPYQYLPINNDSIVESTCFYAVSKLEIYAGKINALISRSQIRDLYDVHRIIQYHHITYEEILLLRNIFLVYRVISGNEVKIEFDINHIERITKKTYIRQLIPVLRKDDDFDFDLAMQVVKDFVNELLKFDASQDQFIKLANEGILDFSLLFTDDSILEKVNKHPMILWKLHKNQSKNRR